MAFHVFGDFWGWPLIFGDFWGFPGMALKMLGMALNFWGFVGICGDGP